MQNNLHFQQVAFLLVHCFPPGEEALQISYGIAWNTSSYCLLDLLVWNKYYEWHERKENEAEKEIVTRPILWLCLKNQQTKTTVWKLS